MTLYNAALVRGGRFPAIVREGILRRRHAMDDAAFRNCVKSGIDAAAALAALGAIGGELKLPDQGEKIILASRPSLTASGLYLRGCPGQGTYGTYFEIGAVSAGLDFTASTESGIDGAYFKRSAAIVPTSGAAIGFVKSGSNNYGCFVRNVRIEECYNGIDVNAATNTRLESKIEIRKPYGTFGVRMYGSSLANRCDKLRIVNLIADAPYDYAVYANSGGGSVASWKGAMGRSTAYIQGDVATSGGNIYQCTTAGTTASGSAPTGQGTAGSRYITDGTVTWLFVCSTSLSWILQDSYGYSLDVSDCALINGAYGFRATDTINNGSSYPTWHYFTNCDFDHPAVTGCMLSAGEDFNASQIWVSSSLAGNGVNFTSAYRGEGGITKSNIRGNAHAGVLHDGGRGMVFAGNDYVDNGQATDNTYSNHIVGAGVSGFQIVNNRFIPTTGQIAQKAKYPVLINSGASDGYVITGNLSKGHGTAGTIQDGGTGVNKVIANNYGF